MSTYPLMDNPELIKLVDELDSLFPHLDPNPTHSIELIMFRSGSRAVVNYLKDKLTLKDD